LRKRFLAEEGLSHVRCHLSKSLWARHRWAAGTNPEQIVSAILAPIHWVPPDRTDLNKRFSMKALLRRVSWTHFQRISQIWMLAS
jgi:hypothetical protein